MAEPERTPPDDTTRAPEHCHNEAPGPLGTGLYCGRLADHDGEHGHGVYKWASTAAPVTAEGSYDWWRTEVAARDADLGRLRNRITALEANGSELLARAERTEAVLDVLSARHQPKQAMQVIRCELCLSTGDRAWRVCPDCREEPITVCSNLTCCRWPCKDREAIDAALGAPEGNAPADGAVLCLCGNPDNCTCPPVERTVRLVIENAAPGGPAHTVIFDGRAYPVLGCKPDGDGMTETYELRQRPTALAGDPGDLPARMAEAMRVALVTWSEGAQHEHLANAALSVRDELVAHLAARVGDAERRAEHAVGQLSALRDHRARWETEKARADAAERKCEMAEQAAQRWHDEYARIEAEVEERQAERDALKAAIEDLIGKAKPRTVYAPKRVIDAADLAALIDAPGGAQ